jgi:hypothetical protein
MFGHAPIAPIVQTNGLVLYEVASCYPKNYGVKFIGLKCIFFSTLVSSLGGRRGRVFIALVATSLAPKMIDPNRRMC